MLNQQLISLGVLLSGSLTIVLAFSLCRRWGMSYNVNVSLAAPSAPSGRRLDGLVNFWLFHSSLNTEPQRQVIAFLCRRRRRINCSCRSHDSLYKGELICAIFFLTSCYTFSQYIYDILSNWLPSLSLSYFKYLKRSITCFSYTPLISEHSETLASLRWPVSSPAGGKHWPDADGWTAQCSLVEYRPGLFFDYPHLFM